MNQRFNDLRLEAGISRLHEVPYMVAVNKEGEIIEPSDGLQKFAELIVRECMNICKNHPSRVVSNNWRADAVAPDIVHRLSEQFGVEE